MQHQDNTPPSGMGHDEGFGDFGVRAGAQFQFTVANNTVTAMNEVIGSRTLSLHIPGDATFAVGSGTVTETLAGEHGTTTLDFQADAANSSRYDLTSITHDFSAGAPQEDAAAYSFTIANGAVTAEQVTRTDDGRSFTHDVTPPPDATFTVGSGAVTETFVAGHAVETLQFVQATSGVAYALASETTSFVLPDGAATLLNVEPFERMQFTIASDGTVTGEARVAPDGTVSAFTPDGHTSFTQLAPGFVEAARTDGAHTSFEVFYAGSGANGTYTAIAEGTGASVDLVGLQHQLAQLPTAAAAVI
ncbi:MAG: hypothetical protein KGO51_05525 [Alphaproteobacteria bacterium]|nr:hypothetical protein [Alphaproteobacteria bacterium]